MKRVLFVLLALMVLFAGCAQTQEDPPATEPAAVTVVNSVDELLAAIAPGATIELGEGEFNLCTASGYGERKGPYYIWTELGLGEYGLQLQYVDGLTIRGQGMEKTRLVTDARFAHVLSIVDSQTVTIEDMTLGHTQMTEACEGGVVYTAHSGIVSFNGLGLYGCGTIGIWAYDSQDLAVVDCEIYDCSGYGISMSQCAGVQVENTKIYSLGKEEPVMACFDFWSCQDVTVEGCTIRDNYVNNLIFAGPGSGVTFSNNTFTENKIAHAAFNFDGEGAIFDNNRFEGTEPRQWYAAGTAKAKDPEGNPVAFAQPEDKPVEPGVAETVSTGEQKEVNVKTVDQFLAAIASDTKIILAEGEYDLSKAKNYGVDSDYYRWEDNYDGPELIVDCVTNLTIEGAGRDKTTISAVPRYANVLTFDGCFGITVKDLTAGHTIEPGYCMGGVLMYRYSDSLLVENCGLYGCGTYGVQTQQSPNLQIVNCEIYECSYGGVRFSDSENISITGTTFRDLGGPTYQLWNCVNVTANGDSLDGNYTGD